MTTGDGLIAPGPAFLTGPKLIRRGGTPPVGGTATNPEGCLARSTKDALFLRFGTASDEPLNSGERNPARKLDSVTDGADSSIDLVALAVTIYRP